MYTNYLDRDSDSDSDSDMDNPIFGISYNRNCIKRNKLDEWVFTFTPEMYDAATPINAPAEE